VVAFFMEERSSARCPSEVLMKASEIMTRQVLSCSKDDTLHDAARVMWESDVGCLVVVDGDNRPVGVLTDRDIAIGAYTQGKPLIESRVATAMSRSVLVCSADSTAAEVEESMREAQLRRIPVVDTDGKLCGIVTLLDLAMHARANPWRLKEIAGVVTTLAAIAEKRPSTDALPSPRLSW
jgi:CBS domain-containing protein